MKTDLLNNVAKDNKMDFGRFKEGSELVLFGIMRNDVIDVKKVIDVTSKVRYASEIEKANRELHKRNTNVGIGFLVCGIITVGSVIIYKSKKKQKETEVA